MHTKTAPESGARNRAAVYVVVLLIVVAAAFVAKLRMRGVFGCQAQYPGRSYVVDCNVSGFGDYDHGAFWFGLEPDAQRAASQARVLLLGNSRLQFGFSSPLTARWFAERSIPFYSLGFSHYESITFAKPILDRVQPRPRAVVINVDRFFAEWLSPPATRVVNDRDARQRHVEKRFWQRLHKPVCGALPALCGDAWVVFRDVGTGLWTTSGAMPDRPAGTADGPADDEAQWPHFIELANGFVDALGVDRSCIVLTIVPSPKTRRAEAEAIARALGTPFIAPRVEGLRTFDSSHLDRPSADLWSKAFLDAAGPVLERCAAGAR